jgi:uracil-DNA glycosylase family 4
LVRAQKGERLEEVSREVVACSLCGLYEGRLNPVPGEGDPDSPVVFVGEAPGREEDEQGRPFVGSAGRLFDRLLGEAGMEREGVYITNILKCRPPGNRRPKSGEIAACSKHLERQLEIIVPTVISPMGNSATGHLMRRFGLKRRSIGRVHGKLYPVEAPWGRAYVFPLYHPAAVLYNRRLEDELRLDLEALMGILGKVGDASP